MQTQRDRQAEREAVYYDEAVRARDISEGELLIGPCAPLSHVGGLLAGLLRSSPQHCMAAVVQQVNPKQQVDTISAQEASTGYHISFDSGHFLRGALSRCQ